jgi:hypothetical protein
MPRFTNQHTIVHIMDGKAAAVVEAGTVNERGDHDGTAAGGSLSGPFALCSEGSTLFVLCDDDTCRMVSGTTELAKWMRALCKAAEIHGILDPAARRRLSARDSIRNVPFQQSVAELAEIVGERDTWYVERRAELDRKASDKSLKGPDGVFAWTSHKGWLRNLQQFESICEYFRAAGLDDLLASLRFHRCNTMPVENAFAETGTSGHADGQTMLSYAAKTERRRMEYIKAHTRTGFQYVTNALPYYPAMELADVDAKDVIKLLRTREFDRKLKSGAGQPTFATRLLVATLAKQKSQKLRDVFKRPVGFPIHISGVASGKRVVVDADEDGDDGEEQAEAAAAQEPEPRQPSSRESAPSAAAMLGLMTQADDEDLMMEEVLEISRLEAKKRKQAGNAMDDEDFVPGQETSDSESDDSDSSSRGKRGKRGKPRGPR